MQRQVTAIALGAFLALVMGAPSFARDHGAAAHRAAARSAPPAGYSRYYDSTAGARSYSSPGYSYDGGGLSGDIGGIGR